MEAPRLKERPFLGGTGDLSTEERQQREEEGRNGNWRMCASVITCT